MLTTQVTAARWQRRLRRCPWQWLWWAARSRKLIVLWLSASSFRRTLNVESNVIETISSEFTALSETIKRQLVNRNSPDFARQDMCKIIEFVWSFTCGPIWSTSVDRNDLGLNFGYTNADWCYLFTIFKGVWQRTALAVVGQLLAHDVNGEKIPMVEQ